jgi:hypothetical protein
MRGVTGILSFIALFCAGAASAAPGVEIEHAAARVTVIPEARSDISVTVVHANPRLPLKVTRVGDRVIIDGGLGWRSPNCHQLLGHPSVSIWLMGDFGWDSLPQVVIRTPRGVHVASGGAVFGVINAGDSIDLASSGCGDWSVADQSGPLRVHLSGSGDVHAGSAASADLALSGSSNFTMKSARGGLSAAQIAGSGDIAVHDGTVGDMDVAVSGSGNVHFGGVARSLEARVSGSGDVSVARVTGPVAKHVTGSGDISIGR